jgi:2C-methyl-D-erythritol 2,4-cyclodiphosphate synthase
MVDNNLLTFHEKVDNIFDEHEQLQKNHLEYLKEAAQLLTQEGEIISGVQTTAIVDQDMDDYVNKMEKIVARNLEIYSDMAAQLARFKALLKDEEEAHKRVGRETFHYY